MNGVVGIVTGGDKVFGVEQNIAAVGDVFRCDRIHVMNKNPAVNIETFRAEVAAIVTNDDIIAYRLPFF